MCTRRARELVSEEVDFLFSILAGLVVALLSSIAMSLYRLSMRVSKIEGMLVVLMKAIEVDDPEVLKITTAHKTKI